jgi:predicted DCC family thiol-disulfide oxidoreductase YuxK
MNETRQVSVSEYPRAGWILYDGECSFCTRWVHLWEKVVAKRGFVLEDLQSAWAEGRFTMSKENLLDDIRVLTRNSDLINGADAYLYVTRRIWWAWPFYAIFSLPGFHWVLWRGYRWFARNRYCASGRCRRP